MTWIVSAALMADYVNYVSSLAPEEAYSAGDCAGGERYAPSRLTLTRRPFCAQGRTMARFRRSRYGMTCARLTGRRGADILTWFREGFRARISVSPEMEPESKEVDPDSGNTWPESFARFDPNTSSWKTCQRLLDGGLEEFSGIWPRWGTMRNGVCWEAPPLTLSATASASGYSLLRPIAQCWKAWTFARISSLIRRNHADGNLQERLARLYHRMITAESNEILMLWPDRWTDLKPLVMDKFRQWLHSHGMC